MGRSNRKRRGSTTENIGRSEKVRTSTVNVSSEDEISEPAEGDTSDIIDTSNKEKNVTKNGGGDDGDDNDESYEAEPSGPQTESDDSDDEALAMLAKRSKSSTSRPKSRNNAAARVTDEMINEKEPEVEAILEHKIRYGWSKYLIKWKDHSEGETWETALKIMSIAQDVLDKFVEENPDCAPVTKIIKKRKRKVKREDQWEDSETDLESRCIRVTDVTKEIAAMSDDDDDSSDVEDDDDSSDSVEWDVERIVGVKKIKGESREFLIRWKGYGAKYDSWEKEEQLNCPDLIEQFFAADETKKDENVSQSKARIQSKRSDLRTPKFKTSTNRRSKKIW